MSRFFAGVLTAMLIVAATPAAAQPGPGASSWDHVARVVVVGDLHGDYAKFHDMLKQAGLIDGKDAWTGGSTHLVQLGDVPDRAPETRKILDLLMRLEPQARRSGGFVHALIGNHEAMNMEGDLRYTTPGEFAAFADRDSPRRRDTYYAAVVAALTAHPPAAGLPAFDAAYRAKFDEEHPLGWVEHRQAWAATGIYGRWVLTHSAVIRIDDTLYMHGGLGPEFTAFDIDVMNRAVAAALRHEPETAGGPHDILWNAQGPLWYRGLAQADEATEGANLAAILAKHHVARIVLGHTKQYPRVDTRFDGAVVLTDIAVRTGCSDPHAFLIKAGPKLTTIYRGHTLDLGVAGPAQESYRSQIAAFDKAESACPAG